MKKSLAVKNYFTLTNFDENLNGYIKQISKYPILDSNKEKELAKKIAEGDLQAKKELVQSNLRLVFNVARKSIHSTSLSMSDLIQ